MKTIQVNTKKISIAIVIPAMLLLSGCQNMLKTMVAHIRIDSKQTAFIAKGNAYTNFCMSKSLINRQTAYEFSTVAAELLDLVVFDNDFYKTSYENTIQEMNDGYLKSPDGAGPGCKGLEENLPKVTTELNDAYRKYAQELGVARSDENRRLAQTMSNFKLPSTPVPQMNFPNVNFSQEKSSTQNFLVNTKSGLTQCRVTNGNFVFCL